MGKYAVDVQGSTYEVEAPDENTAWQWAVYTHKNPEKPKEKTWGEAAKDVGVTALKGAIGLPQAAVGLLDIPTLGYASKGLEAAGIRFADAQKILDQEYSPAQQEAFKKVEAAEGFVPTAKAMLQNPSVPAHMLGQSVPQMIGGAGIGRKALQMLPAMGEAVAAGVGEGVLGAGSAASQIRESTPEGVLTPKQALAALGSGVGTGAFGVVGSKIAGSKVGQRLGLSDIDTMLVHGGPQAEIAGQAKSGFIKAVIGSGISEGALEELPQSVQEQMWQNWATDKPITEGLGKAAATGLVTGSVAGGAAGGFGNLTSKAPPPPPPPEAPTGMQSSAERDETIRLMDVRLAELRPGTSVYKELADAKEKYLAKIAAEDAKKAKKSAFIDAEVSPEGLYLPPTETAEELPAEPLPKRRGNQIQGNLFTKAEAPVPEIAPQEIPETPAPEPVEPPAPQQMRLPFTLDKHTIDTLGIKGFGSKKLKADLLGVDIMTPEGRAKLEETLGKAQNLDVKAEDFLGLLPPIAKPSIAGVPESGVSGEGIEQPISQPTTGRVGTSEVGRPGVGTTVKPSGQPPAGKVAQPSALTDELVNRFIQAGSAFSKTPMSLEQGREILAKYDNPNKFVAAVETKAAKDIKTRAAQEQARKENLTARKVLSIGDTVAINPTNFNLEDPRFVETFGKGNNLTGVIEDFKGEDSVWVKGLPNLPAVSVPAREITKTTQPSALTGEKQQGVDTGLLSEEELDLAKTSTEISKRVERARKAFDKANNSLASDDPKLAKAKKALEQAEKDVDSSLQAEYDFYQKQKIKSTPAAQPVAKQNVEDIPAPALLPEIVKAAPRRVRPEPAPKVTKAAPKAMTEAEMNALLEEKDTGIPVKKVGEKRTQETTSVKSLSLAEAKKPLHKASADVRAFDTEGVKIDNDEGDYDELNFDFESPRESKGKPAAPTGNTVKTITARIKDAFKAGAGFDRITTVVQSEADLPRELQKPGVKGVAHKGRVYLVADNIASGEELGVFLHEAGGHLGFDRVLGAEGRANLARQVRGWAKDNDLKGLAAQEAIRKGGASNDEVIAYTIEELVNRGVQPTSFSAEGNWLKRIMSAFRAALKRLGFTQNLTPEALVDAAFGAAHIEMTGIENVQKEYATGVKLEKQLFGKTLSKKAEAAVEPQRNTYNDIRNNFGLDPVNKWDTVPLDRVENKRMESVLEGEVSPETRLTETKPTPRYSTANPAMDAVDSRTLDLVSGVSAPKSIVNNAINTVAGPGEGSIAQKIRQNMASRLTWWEDWFASLHGNNALDAANLASANDRLQASTKVKNIQLATLEMGGFGKNAKGLWEAQHTDASYKDVLSSVNKMVGKYAQTPDFASAEKYFNLAAIAKREEGLMASKQTTDTGGVIERALSDARLKMGLDIYRTTPEVREALDTYKKFNDRNVDSLVTAGVIDAATAKDLKGNAGYVPWFRFVQDKQGNIDIKAVKQFSKGLTNLSEMRDLEGGKIEDVQINNVLDNMAMLSNWMVNKSVGNDTAAYMTKIAVAHGRAKKVGSPVASGVDPKRVVQILDNGNPTFYQFDDPMALPAFKGYEAAHGAMTEILAAPTRWLRKGITLFPVFSIAQLPQDTIRAMVTGGLKNPYALPAKVLSNFVTEIFGGSTTSQRLAQFGVIGRGIDLPTEEISKGFRRRLGMDSELSLFQRGIDLLEKLSNASDAAVRAALYEQTLKETGNEVLAIRRARDIINFDIQGSSGYSSFLRQTVPFMGVYMNDLNNLYKGLVLGGSRLSEGDKKATRQAIIASGLNLAFLTVLYTLLVSDDDDYKNLNDQTRNRSFIIPGTSLRIPVPGDGVGLLFKVLPEQLTRLYLTEGIESKDIEGRVGRALFKGFSDMGSYENWIPGGTLPKVFTELILNKSFFTGNPIVGKSKENLEPFKQFTEGTSETAKVLAASMKEVGINISPIKADYLWRSLTGQVGGTVLGVFNALFNAAEGKTTPSLRLEDVPEIKSFTYSSQDKAALDNFYELRDKIDIVARTYKDMISAGKGKEAIEYMSNPENRKVYALRSVQTRIEQDLAKIRTQRKLILDNQSLNGDEMRERLSRLEDIQEKYLNSMRLPTLRAYANVGTDTTTNLSRLLR